MSPEPLAADAGRSRSDALRAVGVGMRFDSRWVLRDVDLTVQPGRIYGLVGHNGSGKSTLIKIIAGYHAPTEGEVTIGNELVSQGVPARSYAAGLRFVHQDLGLIAEFSALENFGIGGSYPRTRLGAINWRRQRQRLTRVLETFETTFPVDVPVGRLSAVERSLVAIARATSGGQDAARYLVLDEPTTALEQTDVSRLFGVVRRLAADGIGVIFVSHQLKDILGLCETIAVLRDGRLVDTLDAAATSHGRLVESMLGDESGMRAAPPNAKPPPTQARPVLAVSGLRSRLLRGVDLHLQAHECVCVLGLAGSGREELTYALAGAVESTAERVEIEGRAVAPLRPRDCRRHRIALVPGNRMPGSLVADFRVRENVTLASLPGYRRWAAYIDNGAERRDTRSWIERLSVQPDDAEYATRHLSGGNKQKLILAKWLAINPVAMLIDEPTAGVDVGAAAQILAQLRALVDKGMAVLITTSEIDDAMALADRVLIVTDGQISAELRRSAGEITEAAIVLALSRAHDEPASYSRTTVEADR
jgi:ribose transport system ATP-binding protein